MNSSRAKIAVGCTLALAIPLLLIAATVAGLFVKSFNEVREFNHQTVWQATQALISSFVHENPRLTPEERDRREINSSAKILACPFAILMIGGYFVPVIIAIRRRHRQVMAIAVLNAFLGWTFLGWLASLVWSLVATDDANGTHSPQVGAARFKPGPDD